MTVTQSTLPTPPVRHHVHLRGKWTGIRQTLHESRGGAALTLASSTQHSAKLRKRRPLRYLSLKVGQTREVHFYAMTLPQHDPVLVGPRRVRPGVRGREGRGLRGAELVARRAASRPLGKWMLRRSAGAGGGDSIGSASSGHAQDPAGRRGRPLPPSLVLG